MKSIFNFFNSFKNRVLFLFLMLILVNVVFYLIGYWQITMELIYKDLEYSGEKYVFENTVIFLVNGILGFLLLYEFFIYLKKEYKFKINSYFIMFISYIAVLGGVLRAINDYYKVSILLITPFIYLLLLGYFLAIIFLVVIFKEMIGKDNHNHRFIGASFLTFLIIFIISYFCLNEMAFSLVIFFSVFISSIPLLNLKLYDKLFVMSFFAGLFDAGITLYAIGNGYYEKQILSSLLMLNPILYVMFKISIISLLFLMFKLYDEKENKLITLLMANGVFILNFAPFIRDLIRVVSGW